MPDAGAPIAQACERICLRCRKPFNSEGPHNRLCAACGPAVASADQRTILAGSVYRSPRPPRGGALDE